MKVRPKAKFTEIAGPACLGIASVIGQLKGSFIGQSLPIDASLALTLTVASIALLKVFQSAVSLRRSFWVSLLLFGPLGISLSWSSWSEYSVTKFKNGIVIGTVLSFAAALVLVDSRAIRIFLRSLFAVSLTATTLVLIGVGNHIRAANGRWTLGGGTITLGRMAGLLVLTGTQFLFDRHGRRTLGRFYRTLAYSAAIFCGVIAMLGSGSRGPVMALATAVIAQVLRRRGHYSKKGSRRLSRLAIILSVFVFALGVAFRVGPSSSLTRFENLSSDSAQQRAASIAASRDYILTHPLGTGLGDFGEEIKLFGGENGDGQGRNYPHNIFAEIGVEAGWIGLLIFVCLSTSSVRHLFGRRDDEGQFMLPLLLYLLTNSMVSGDVTDNRALMLAISAALALLIREKSSRQWHQLRLRDPNCGISVASNAEASGRCYCA